MPTDIDITLNDTAATDANKDNQNKPIPNVTGSSCTMAMVSDNNNLSNITLSNGTLSPTFDPNVLSYSATIDAEKITVTYQKADRRASVSCNPDCNNVSLNYGNNKIEIKVTAESGASKTCYKYY